VLGVLPTRQRYSVMCKIPTVHKVISWMSFVRNPVIKVNSNADNRNCITFDECALYLEGDTHIKTEKDHSINFT
jgi:hypothetical protein